MKSVFSKYLLKDDKLNYKLIWRDLATDITGWDAQKRRETQYHLIQDWFQERVSDSAKGRVSERESILF